ncbi:tripartite-type tricarboxylate transporter receptor subunit TctC [Variovorax sp. TBS-050B]|uniref:Bug family tripartite tricarboxylate transporter substrate binding protein n=1 Tax=Variovorax sp. TBS-050B TaxID=2940551 RepID=UPI0024761AA5|nr:Bug family tripartite tricarboxylate transporter substrate binding protein [Variovorax sp. TBS-050B]MDH6590134.1 tripartite-type tricarboxylate transporter receptor subunit TctC [Variovorax sp. TBS-050B]
MKKRPLKVWLHRLVLVAAAAVAASAAVAQQTGRPPARILVGFSPGGTLDVVTRALAEQLHDPLSRPVVVENKPGAGGKLAIDALRAAPADGSVAMLCPDFLVSIYPFVFNKLAYDPERDILPVSTVVEFPMALAVPSSSPVRTFGEYAQWVRAHPERANFGHAASGGPTHFLGLRIASIIGTPLQDIPFQGAAPMIVNLAGANVAAGTSTVGDFAQHHHAGKLRVLAVTSAQRSPLLPEVPTFGELGRKELTAVGVLSICLPPGTPSAVVSEWSSAVRKAAASAQFAGKVRTLGFVNTGSSPADARARFGEMRRFWEPVVRASGFKAD